MVKQETGNLGRFKQAEIKAHIAQVLAEEPHRLYNDSFVKSDTRVTRGRTYYRTADTNRKLRDVITEMVLECPTLGISQDAACTYNSGTRKDDINARFEQAHGWADYSAYFTGKTNERETRLCHCIWHALQGDGKGIRAVDFQIPTTNGKGDKIDLLLRDGDTFLMTEVKTIGSDESMLRCVLEIETYYEKLNERFYKQYGIPAPENLKRAVLVDKSSAAWAHRNEPLMKALIEHFKIVLLELDIDGGMFAIDYADR